MTPLTTNDPERHEANLDPDPEDGGLDGEAAAAGPLSLLPWVLLPLLASWGYGLWLYGQLPAQVPLHWGLNGQVDRYGGPLEAAYLLPILLTVFACFLLLAFVLGIPGGGAYASTRRAFAQLIGIVMCFMLYLQVITSWMFRGQQVALLSWLTLGAGAMFILMGNLLPKLRRNRVAGVRLPWTMKDDATWIRSQRMAGLSFVILGVILLVLSRLPGWLPLAAVLGGKAVVVSLIIWYSLRISRRQAVAG